MHFHYLWQLQNFIIQYVVSSKMLTYNYRIYITFSQSPWGHTNLSYDNTAEIKSMSYIVPCGFCPIAN
jgi:hypothetical protein